MLYRGTWGHCSVVPALVWFVPQLFPRGVSSTAGQIRTRAEQDAGSWGHTRYHWPAEVHLSDPRRHRRSGLVGERLRDEEAAGGEVESEPAHLPGRAGATPLPIPPPRSWPWGRLGPTAVEPQDKRLPSLWATYVDRLARDRRMLSAGFGLRVSAKGCGVLFVFVLCARWDFSRCGGRARVDRFGKDAPRWVEAASIFVEAGPTLARIGRMQRDFGELGVFDQLWSNIGQSMVGVDQLRGDSAKGGPIRQCWGRCRQSLGRHRSQMPPLDRCSRHVAVSACSPHRQLARRSFLFPRWRALGR